MRHITLLTGDCRESPRAEVHDGALAAVRPWLAPGEHAIDEVPGGYRLFVRWTDRGWVGTVFQGRVPVATIGVAADADDAATVWPVLMRLQRMVVAGEVATEPPATPWVGVALLAAAPATSDWLADLERCLAWAWLEERDQ